MDTKVLANILKDFPLANIKSALTGEITPENFMKCLIHTDKKPSTYKEKDIEVLTE